MKMLAYVIGIYLSVWAIRKRYEVDYKLDVYDQVFRLGFAALGIALGIVPGSSLGWLRATGGLLFLAFLCWPNLGYYVSRFFGRHRDETMPWARD